MRNLFLVLVLANLGFLAWASWFAAVPVPGARYDGPGIALLRELDAAAPAPRSPAAADRCIAIGPFTAAADADAAMETLEAAGFAPTLATRQHEVRDGFWVFIEEIDSMERAQEIDAELDDNGIPDAYPLTGTDRGVLISLGVFSDISRAGAQAERVGRLGYEATIAENTRTEDSYWLDLRLAAEAAGAIDLLQEPGRINRFEERACEPAD